MINYRQLLKDFSFYLLDKRKQRGFHLLNDLRYLSTKSSQPVNLIFDVGANIGQSTVNYKKYFPGSKIYAFEPVDDTFKELRKNTANLNNVFIQSIAFSNKVGEKRVVISNSNLTNSLRNEVIEEKTDQKTQIFKVDTIDNFCKVNHIEYIDLLKTDTEGSDFEVLQGAYDKIKDNKIRFIVVEVSFDPSDKKHTGFELVNRFLWENGYGVVGFYDFGYKRGVLPITKYCDALYIKIDN